MMKNTRHLFACQMLYRLSYRRNLYVVRLRGLEPPTLWFQQLVKLLIVSFKSSRLVACSFPSDMRRRSSRTMSSNSFSFTVTSLLKMCRFLGNHAIHSILGYIACLFSMVSYACVVLHASSFKRKPFMHVVIEYLTLQWGVEHLTDKIIQKIKTHKFVGIEPTRFSISG